MLKIIVNDEKLQCQMELNGAKYKPPKFDSNYCCPQCKTHKLNYFSEISISSFGNAVVL